MARKVRLRQEWTLGPRIGDPLGFGKVFAATAALAVKLGTSHLVSVQAGLTARRTD
jgi:hypothetical protein